MSVSSPGAVARLRRAVFARHSNPWSAWSRWATSPLILVPVWTRSWKPTALVAGWMALNPVLFPEPADDSAWATRAMLGEERWITERPRDAAMAVQAATSVASMLAIAAAYRRRPVGAGAATAAMMGLTMVYWEQMARYYDRHVADARAGGD
ncbi:DUF6653 family protein [Streptomonospora wellingtoniae]|uniref:DUF6653 family protein n=1 Tax=Streptomonospora wellingtoniae TaxID=3075544 RepID=A0ABU2L0A5_9ACTN|nr:DUF6653 family protein [Streptomonospora sp. DSM 45055]MDT0304986.1 DUF6653 family protein [Streptomonospora sp. DSM 45055]